MRIYISGKITGLPFREVEHKFQSAQNFLEGFGFEVVSPLKNGLSQSHTWQQHIVRDIELLLPCEAIYMLDDWVDSVGAGIEYDVAVRTGKIVLFETNTTDNQKSILKIQNTAHGAMNDVKCMSRRAMLRTRSISKMFPPACLYILLAVCALLWMNLYGIYDV
jgi:hypothetical protein